MAFHVYLGSEKLSELLDKQKIHSKQDDKN